MHALCPNCDQTHDQPHLSLCRRCERLSHTTTAVVTTLLFVFAVALAVLAFYDTGPHSTSTLEICTSILCAAAAGIALLTHLKHHNPPRSKPITYAQTKIKNQPDDHEFQTLAVQVDLNPKLKATIDFFKFLYESLGRWERLGAVVFLALSLAVLVRRIINR